MTRSLRILIWLLPVVAILQIAVLYISAIPLGIPGEWTWTRVPAEALGEIPWFPVLLTTIFFIGWLRLGEERISEAPRRVYLFWLLILTMFAIVQLWTIRALPAGIFNHSGQIWVTYYPRMSGYFTQATTTNRSVAEFLADYEDEVRAGDYLHQGTHPPGLPVGFLVGKQLLEGNPRFTTWLNSWQPPDVAMGIDTLGELAQMEGKTLSEAQRGLLWGHLLFSYILAAATLLPIAAICRAIDLDRRTTWWLAGVWCLCPAITVFMPKSDVLFPFFSAGTLAAYAWSCRVEKNWQRVTLGILAGCFFWCGMFCSLAFLALLPVLVLWSLMEAWLKSSDDETTTPQRLRHFLACLPWGTGLSFLAAFGACIFCCWLAFDINLLTVWAINFSKHAEFYDHNPRTYGLWLPTNLIELSFSLGLPLFLLIVCGLLSLLKPARENRRACLMVASVATWAVLWLSGKNMGEAARLWVFLLPLLLPIAGICLNRRPAEKVRPVWLTLLICQTVLAAVAAVMIDGFSFTQV